MRHLPIVGALVLATTALGLGVVPALSQSSQPGPLRPLSLADTNRIKESGCVFSFDSARKTMFYSVENVLMVRTAAGPQQCRIPDRTIGLFRDAKGPIACGGQTLSLKRAGRLRQPAAGSEADGSSYPATLTIGTGQGATTLMGTASTAC